MKSRVIHGVIVVLTLVLISVICPGRAAAETGYVSDRLILTMRDGPGKEFKIQRSIPSDTQVTILETKDNYFRVRIKTGEVGWVESQYITWEVPARLMVGRLEQKIKEMEERQKALMDDKAPLEQELNQVRSEYGKKVTDLEALLKKSRAEKKMADAELKQAVARYDALASRSEDVVTVMDEQERLQKENERLTRELARLGAEGEDSLKTGMIKWFLAGAGALLAGWLMGRSMGSRRRQRGLLG